jgi:hypothetical protein
MLYEVTSVIEKLQNDVKSGVEEVKIAPYIDVAIGSFINNLLFGYRFDGVS